MTKKTLEQLQEDHSEMCATAADLGMQVPEDLTIEFDNVEMGSTVCSNLDALIRQFRAGVDEENVEPNGKTSLAEDDKKEQASPPKKMKVTTAKKADTMKKVTKTKPVEAPPEATGETTVASAKKKVTPAKKVGSTKKVTKKVAAKNGAAKTTAPKKRAGAFDDNAKITWGAKPNPARETSGRHGRIALVEKANGKTVKTFLAAKGNATTLANCVKAKLCTVG